MTLVKTTSLAFLLCASITVLGCDKGDKADTTGIKKLPTAIVSVAKVTSEIAPNQIELVGTIQAVEQAEISSKISGNILEITVDLGSRVQKGDLLVKLSAGEISAQVQQAAAQLEQAKRNLAREEKLLKQNAATPETVKTLNDTVRISQAAFLESQTMLDYTVISAPFTGIITQKVANVGDLATPGKPLLRIEGENNLEIVTDIPESLVHKVELGEVLHAIIPATGTKVSGVVTEISPTADPSSRTTPIKIKIDNEPILRSGQFARVMFTFEGSRTLAVPEDAVVPYGQMDRVFIAKDQKSHLRLVRTGSLLTATDGSRRIEILSGLSEGETVVTVGNNTLQAGQPIKIQ